jgi:hypothetical protein
MTEDEDRQIFASPWTDDEARSLVALDDHVLGAEYRARSLASARTPIPPASTLGGPAGGYAPYAAAYRRNLDQAIVEVLACSAPTPTGR